MLPGEGLPMSSNTFSQCCRECWSFLSVQIPPDASSVCWIMTPLISQADRSTGFIPTHAPHLSRELNFSPQTFCGKWDTSPESEHLSPSPEITLTSCVREWGNPLHHTLNPRFLIHFLIVFTEGLSVIRNAKDKKGKVLSLKELILAENSLINKQLQNCRIIAKKDIVKTL